MHRFKVEKGGRAIKNAMRRVWECDKREREKDRKGNGKKK